ncbi:PREDICTED: classical arabinogalactan protein 25-like [Lupinus angustifolius]|uniref:classical arabinogalactan protein 25-like n=1 Tax=Lupinus angustifolius TaxID=3871 RepID=UPI00092F8802|nr:PREDICTED: classical arabinogalactan protein 25-like [Lupinus angustifolius]
MMASVSVYLVLMIIISFMPSPLHSSYSQSSLSPFQELSPDIAPLFPSSPDDVLPTPGGSEIPTIPSNPSSNPDDMVAPGPLSAFSPFGSMSSNAPTSLVCNPAIAAFTGLAAYWYMQCIRV